MEVFGISLKMSDIVAIVALIVAFWSAWEARQARIAHNQSQM